MKDHRSGLMRRALTGAVLIAAAVAAASSTPPSAAGQRAAGAGQSPKRMPDGKWWTTVNLAIAVASSYCYEDAEEHCRRYGRLYTWDAAGRACRAFGDGWRLPSNEEWARMARSYGGVRDESADGGRAAYAALILGGRSGFDAVYGGGRSARGEYARLDAHGFYWTASATGPTTAWFYNLGRNGRILNRHEDGEKERAFAVRCVKD